MKQESYLEHRADLEKIKEQIYNFTSSFLIFDNQTKD